MNDRGNQRARRRAWVAFATGLEIFNISVVYAIFVPYFVATAADDPAHGQALWGYAAGAGGLAGALLAVPAGFAAERPRLRQKLLAAALLLNAAPAFVLWLAEPGLGGAVMAAVLVAMAIAMAANDINYALLGGVLHEVAPSEIMGRTSAAAVSVGWTAGIAVTAAYLALFVWGDPLGVGLSDESARAERLIGPVAGTLMVLMCAPLVLLPAPERATPETRSWRQWLREETASLMSERLVALAVIARIFYWSGLVLVTLFGPALARTVFSWDTGTTSIFGITVLAFGALGALLGGWIDDRLGSRDALIMTLVGMAMTMGAILTLEPDRILFFIEVSGRAADEAMLSSTAERVAIGLGALSGLFIGPVGPITRSLVSRLAPPGRVSRYFGISALAGNMTNAFGPFVVAIVTQITGNQRIGLLAAPAFLLLGAALLLRLPRAIKARVELEGAAA